MYTQILRLAVIAAAFLIAIPASAQHFNHGGDEQLGFSVFSPDNCGRRISQQQAEGIWGGYCTESCGFTPSGNTGYGKKCGSKCGLRNKLHGGHGGCGCGGNSGSFNYPAGGCGCGGGGFHDGGCGCGGGGFHGGDDCGKPRHGCCKLLGGCKAKGGHGGCKSRQFGGHHGGCKAIGGHGCKSRKLGGHHGGCKAKGGHGCKSRHGCCKLFGGCKKFGRSAQQCGTSGAYFEEAVGFEYGTSGIQSCVSCNTCGSFNQLVQEADAQSVLGGFDNAASNELYPQSLPLQHIPASSCCN